MTPQDAARITSRIESMCAELQEFGCDSVQILATVHCNRDGTSGLMSGLGNFYARLGLAREFLARDEARTHINVDRTE